MKYPNYVKTADGYVGTFAYRTPEGPVYRFPGGTRLADSWELEHGSNDPAFLDQEALDRFGRYDAQPCTVTLTNDEWAGVLAMI